MKTPIKIALTGTSTDKYLKIIEELILDNTLAITTPKECEFLVVGDDAPNDVFADVIFNKERQVQIITDNQFSNLLKDKFPEYYL